jgi:hypothetical protein
MRARAMLLAFILLEVSRSTLPFESGNNKSKTKRFKAKC